jgi:ankyrin repeat protein
VSINARDKYGQTALMFAAGNSQLEVIKHLVRNGALVNIKDTYNFTALGYAKRSGCKRVVTFLKVHGAHE